MARRRDENAEELETSTLRPTELQAEEAVAKGAPTAVAQLPTLDQPEEGKVEVDLEEPISVFVRDQSGGLRPGEVIGLERWAGVAPMEGVPMQAAGARVKAKGVAETVYRVRIPGPGMTPQEVPVGSFYARELVLPAQVVSSLMPKKGKKGKDA